MTNPADKLSLLMATPNEEPVSQYKGVVQQTQGSKAYVLIDGGTAVWCDTMDVKALVGDRVRVEVRKHKGTLVANYTHPVTDDAVANAADDKATEALGKVETLEVDALKADSAVIKNLQADTAKVHDLTADQLSAATAYVGELTAGEVTAQSIIADKAKLAQVDTDQLHADHAVIEMLDSTYASIGSLTAATARIGDIEADYLKAADMTAEQARVGQLMAGKADVADLTAANARIDSLESTKADISFLESDYITAAAIEANYLHADMSNADVAWIQNGVIKDGSISNAMINSLSANKLTAGTINGSVINVTNLNADNITAGTINGQRIGEGSLSLDKLSEDVYTEQEVDNKLATMQAEIDGAIETWTGTAVPTLNNSPASDWTTAAVRDTHVGDVYFVVNSQSEQNGYNYRFTKSGNTYSWQLIKDSDVTNALQRLSTAEGKITTFDSDISTLKTDTGTLKTKTESLETRMSDAEDDILDKVDTTTFNEVSDTVDQHSQSITQMSQTLSNKADGSTVTALTTRVSKTEQDITGINTTIGELQDTVETKADGSTVSTISNKLNTVSDTVDGHTQTLTSVQNTLSSKADSSTVSTLTTKVNNVSDTVDGHTAQLSSITTTQTSIQGSAVKSTVQLWFTKANTTAPSKPTAHVTTNNASTANAWNLAVPTYNSSYPYYYYCYEHQLLNDTYTWSAVTRDIATEESQSTSRSAASAAAAADTKAGNAASAAAAADTKAGNAAAAAATADGKAVSAQNTADKNVRESQQLWYTKANSTAPAKPTSKVTSTATTGGAWTTRVPTYSDSYKHYFYCMQYIAADGTVTWSDVIYDQATTEAQSVARAASADLTEFHQEYATFKQTTQEFESTVGETYATKTALDTTNEKIDGLEIGGRNYAATNFERFPIGTSETRQSGVTATLTGPSTFTLDGSCTTQDWFFSSANVFGGLTLKAGTYKVWCTSPNVNIRVGVGNSGNTWFAAHAHCTRDNPFTLEIATEQAYYFTPYANNGDSFSSQDVSLMVERGSKPTDWSPAPEDLDAHFESVESSITQTADSITESVEKKYATKDESRLDIVGTGASVGVDSAASANLKGLVVRGESSQDGTPTPSAPKPIYSVGSPNMVSNSDVRLVSTYGSKNDSTSCVLTRTIPKGTVVIVSCHIEATNVTWAGSGSRRAGVEINQPTDGTSSGTQYVGVWWGISGSNHQGSDANFSGTLSAQVRLTRDFVADGSRTLGVYIQNITGGSITVSEPSLTVGYFKPYVPSDSIAILVKGRNMLGLATAGRYTNVAANGITWTMNDDGTVSANGTSTAMSQVYWAFSEEEAYSFDGMELTGAPNVSGCSIRLEKQSSPYTAHAVDTGSGATVSFPSGADGACYLYCRVDSGKTVDVTFRPMIRRPSQPNEYEPYSGTVVPIPMNGHELRSLPDGTRDELTIDVDGHVTMTQRVEAHTLTSATAWSVNASLENYGYFYTRAFDSEIRGNYVYTGWCDRFPVSDTYLMPSRATRDLIAIGNDPNGTNSLRLSIAKSLLSEVSLAGLRTWLDANPTTFYYPLATPQTIDLGTIDMPQVKDGDTVEVIAALTPSIDVTWWASAGQAVADAYASLSSAIEVKAESIVSTVSERYATSQEVQAISSQIEQTAEGWGIQFKNLLGTPADGQSAEGMTLAKAFEQLGVTEGNLEQIRSYVRIAEETSNGETYPVLLMGAATSPIMLALSNKALEFRQGDTKVAWIEVVTEDLDGDGVKEHVKESLFHIEKGVVDKELQFGSWKWFERDGVGNLALKWVGDE